MRFYAMCIRSKILFNGHNNFKYPHLTDKETEVQQIEITYPRSKKELVAELRLKLRP